MPTASPLPAPLSTRTRLLGEVITWTCPGLSVPHVTLVEALASSDLDPGVARELAPRHVCGLTGYSATLSFTNLFCLPSTLPEFLALPREVFDSAEELADSGWCID